MDHLETENEAGPKIDLHVVSKRGKWHLIGYRSFQRMSPDVRIIITCIYGYSRQP